MARWTEAEISGLMRRQRETALPRVAGALPSQHWPELAHFFGGYLHQDFDLDGTPEECVALAIEDHDQREREQVLKSLAELRSQGWSEDELARALGELGMYYLPYADDRTHEEWLEWVEAKVATALRPSRLDERDV